MFAKKKKRKNTRKSSNRVSLWKNAKKHFLKIIRPIGKLIPFTISKKPKKKSIKKRNYKRSKNNKKSWIRRFFAWMFSLSIMGAVTSICLTFFIAGLGLIIYFAHDLPDVENLNAARQTPGIVVLDKQGNIIGRYGNVHGDYLEFGELPQYLVNAVLATEDRHFFSHIGIDPIGITRAMVVNVKKGGFVQGGSTITQQLAKNLFLAPDKTLRRKVQEMILAFALEATYSKEEILSIYLNRVYMGGGNYGVDAASRYYFDKPAVDMTLAESAMIAGLLKAPSRYAPTNNKKLAIGRTKQVLINMVDAKFLSNPAIDVEIEKINIVGSRNFSVTSSKYFADWLVNMLPEYVGNIEEDIIIESTLDDNLQKTAENAVAKYMTDDLVEKRNASQVAMVSMKPDGAVISMMGGKDYANSQYNRATQAKRQPGSAFKMFVYLTAMEMGYHPESYIEDKPIKIRGWSPKNYNNKYRGHISLREALMYSVNTVAVQLGQLAGINKVINTAKRLGIKSKLMNIASLPLGAIEVTPLEITTSFAHLSSGGKAVQPYGVNLIRSRATNKVLYKHEPIKGVTVIQKEDVAKVNSMLSSVITNGTGRGASIGRSAAGKTGTTSGYKDAWFVGYTSKLTTAVWVGNDNSTPMKRITGGSIPARIWQSYMSSAHRGLRVASLPTAYSRTANLPWGEKGETDLDNSFWNTLFDDKKPSPQNEVVNISNPEKRVTYNNDNRDDWDGRRSNKNRNFPSDRNRDKLRVRR